MDIVLLEMNARQPTRTQRADPSDGLLRAGASAVERFAASGPAEVDAAIGELAGRRLVLDADLAGLNLALSRLLRAGLLGAVDTAVLPRHGIGYLRRVGLPRDQQAQLRVAVAGDCRLVGVIKDDSGGVCLDSATVRAWDHAGAGWWLRAVVDDQRLADGTAREVSVRRLGPAELEATVRLDRFRRRSIRGRSLQLACDPALVVQDGIGRERPRGKRTLWSEPALWRLAL